jgi:cytochrome c2
MNSGSTGPLSASGEKVFAELGCSTCHRSDMPGRGPNLHGVFGKPVQLADGRTVTADENYLRESILDPGSKRVKGFQPVMPTFQGLVNEEQVNALVAYIKSISEARAGDGASARLAAPSVPVEKQLPNKNDELGAEQATAQASGNQVQVQRP